VHHQRRTPLPSQHRPCEAVAPHRVGHGPRRSYLPLCGNTATAEPERRGRSGPHVSRSHATFRRPPHGSRRDAPRITVGVTHPMPGQVKIPGARRGPHNTLRGDARCITARESLSAARRLLDRPRGRVLPLSRPSVMHGASPKAYPTPNRAESIPQERGGWHVGGDAPCITAQAVG